MKSQQSHIDNLYNQIADIIVKSREQIAVSINLTMVYANFEIGKYIVEDEQGGETRAQYGKAVLKGVSLRLTEKFGSGFSVDNLERAKKFYLLYSNRSISATVSPKLESNNFSTETSATALRKSKIQNFVLSWSHYIELIKIKNEAERNFYEIEAFNNHWSVRQLSRQYASSLYERLALSRDKKSVMKLATEGQVVAKPEDVIKCPITLEFLGIDEKSQYSETNLETAIISKLQLFLLEMGKGFLFEARQKRFSYDNQHFFVDLVLYNRLLQCYVLIDFKTDTLKHQDLGQMLMYVNYYDRFIKQDFEKPTIGILLCKNQNKTIVELTLPKDANIYSTEYSLYLPDKNIFQTKLAEWIEEFEDEEKNK